MSCYFLSETENEKYVNTYFRNLKQQQNVQNGKSCTTDETPYLWMQCHSMKTSAVASHKTTCTTLWGVKAIIPFIREVVLATEFAKKCPSLARFPSFARKTGMPLLVSCAECWLVMSDVLSKQGETFVQWSFCRVEQASSTISISQCCIFSTSVVFSQESRKLSTFNIHTQGSPLCQQHFYSLIEKDHLGDWSPEKDQQQSISGLQSPRWSFSIKVCYSWVQTIFLLAFLFFAEYTLARTCHLDFGVHSPNTKNNDHSPCWTLPVHIRWSSIVHFLLFFVVLNPFQSSLVFGSTSSGLAVLTIFFCSYVRRFQFLIQAIMLAIWSWPRQFSEDTSQDLYPCIRLPRITWRLSQLQPFSIWTTHRTTTEPWSRTAENPSVSKFPVWNFFNLKVYSDFV